MVGGLYPGRFPEYAARARARDHRSGAVLVAARAKSERLLAGQSRQPDAELDRGWDRAPPNPSVLAETQWAGFGKEPPKTIPETKIAAPTPIYSSPVASVPAVNARPAAAPIAAAVAAPVAAAPVAAPGWWDSITAGLGSIFGGGGAGMSLAGLGGGYSGYGSFGGGYDPGGYGGTGGTAPGDAGYGSDARSGAGNMGAGNLYA
jgi:hypothetical protein